MIEIKTFKDLESIKNQLPKSNLDIKKTFTSPGLQPIGYENSLFYFEFSEDDVKDFINILERLKTPSDKIYNSILWNIRQKCNEMTVRGVSPVGCFLYATKTVNTYLNYKNFCDEAAEILFTFKINDYLTKELEHILKKWNWIPQLKIAIKLCGKTGDSNLIKLSYNLFGGNENLKVEVFKALINSGNVEMLPFILDYIKNLSKENEKDKQIANYFKENIKFFFPEGKKEIEKVFNSNNITPFGRRVISDLIFKGEIETTSKNTKIKNKPYFIELARISSPNSNYDENKKKDSLKELYNSLNTPSYRASVLFALRFCDRKEAGDYIINTLKNINCSKNEVKEAIMTLGFLSYSSEKDFIINKYLNKVDYKVYVWSYLTLIKDKNYIERLATELFDEESTIAEEVSSVIKQIYKPFPELTKKIIEKFIEKLNSNDEETIIKSIRNIQFVKTAVVSCFKPCFEYMFGKMGYKKDTIEIKSTKVQSAVLNLIKEFISDDNIPDFIENFLFYVINNSDFGENIKLMADKILSSINLGGLDAHV